MKDNKLISAMDLIDEKYMQEAITEQKPAIKHTFSKRRMVVLVAAVIAILAMTLVSVAASRYRPSKDILFGNNTDVLFETEIDPETGESVQWFKPEIIAQSSGVPEVYTLDVPAIVNIDLLPIPEGYELNFLEMFHRADSLDYCPTSVNCLFNVWNKQTDENGVTMITGKMLYIFITETAQDAQVAIEHKGEMTQTKIGDIDLYYYSDEYAHTEPFEHDSQKINYLAIGDGYQITVYTEVYDTNCELYSWEDLPTYEEVVAIIEAVDNMFHPD